MNATENCNNSNTSGEEKPNFDLCFLEDIHGILGKIEQLNDIENLSQKLIELKNKINQAKDDIRDAKGIDNTLEEQENTYKALQAQLEIKQNIVEKYQNFSSQYPASSGV